MGKVFCCSDLHGQYDLFKQIKDYMKDDDKCFVLGDCVDRGPGSIKMFLDIISDKRFTLIKGNHEQMMFEALEDFEDGVLDVQLWFMNGGRQTFEEYLTYDEATRRMILREISKLPTLLKYKDFILSHAGFDWSLGDDADEETLLWDRSHISSLSTPKESCIQVHGHTPTSTISDDCRDILIYADKTKICIDIGAFHFGRVALLDLDTLDVEYFGR